MTNMNMEPGMESGIEAKEISALDRVSDLLKKRNLLLKAKEVSTDNYIGFGNKLGDNEAELRMLLPIAIDELGRKIEATKKFGNVSELETTKETYEKLLLSIANSGPAVKAEEILDGNAFDAATENERTGRQSAVGSHP